MQPPKTKILARERGISLVIVLGSLVFLSMLVVAFLVQMSTELKSSKMYAQGASARIFSQSATNIVMAQINEATKGGTAANPLAWASQPGMIRTYDNAGNIVENFKLYSDTDMSPGGVFNAAAAATALAGWSSNKALYVDLNQPVQVGTKAEFPIVDGNHLVDGSTLTPKVPLVKPDASKTYLTYNAPTPADSIADIDGFYVEKPATFNAANPISPSNTPVPMPVQWLYVLANGDIVAPTDPTANTVTVVGAADSPIVGRVAFWTDDESTKININTASEGTYMDMPRFNSTSDATTLAKNQPGQNEFQRYPGHPATTSLSTVLKKPSSFTDQTWAEELFKIIPRVKEGGSQGGSVATVQSSLLPEELQIDADRLYSSVDELAFKTTMTATERDQNNTAVLNKESLERARFFLTTSSRAPDVNLFNKPRVCLWPINEATDSNHRTPFDQLISFCSTVNDFAFHFLRQDSKSATTDLPDNPSGTGFLGRNRMLVDYLRTVTSQNIPGFGGNFLTKYPVPIGGGPSDRDQILTQIFDYIRCTNLLDAAKKDLPTFVQFAPVSPTVSSPSNSGSGEVTPIKDGGTRGFGRFPTVSKAFLHFIGASDPTVDSTIPAGMIRVRAGFFMEMFDPSQGMVPGYPRFKIRITGLDGFSWGATDTSRVPMQFPSNATLGTPVSYAFGSENFVGGRIGWSVLAYGKGWNTAAKYPFLTASTIDLPSAAGSTFSFGGGTARVEILNADTNAVLQTLNLAFDSTTPTAQFPVPKLAPATLPNSNGMNFRVFASSGGGRLNSDSNTSSFSGASWIIEEDVVRSIQSTGDPRLIAARETVEVSDGLFAAHPNYTNPSKPMAHSLRTSQGLAYHGATGGKLVNVSYLGYLAEYNQNGRAPTSYGMAYNYVKDYGNPSTTGVAVGTTIPFATGNVPGDWDNGFGNQIDGPYINKVDEGDIGSASQLPYYGDLRYTRIANSLFSPNRQVPSAVILGSLPSGVRAKKPWQTLLFRPGPTGHPGLTSPKDHLLLDLFHMPVVEPYAISEPLSTAGRINMNYQIVPFASLTRNTGIRAVLKSEKVIAVPDNKVHDTASSPQRGYKYYEGIYSSYNFRLDIDQDETLAGFRQRFTGNDIFRSASEICDVHLVPTGATYAGMGTYWDTRKATGDNSRERPYATIYPRLTTKSNTFTIHVRAQSLKKVPGTPADRDKWIEGRDQVTGEYRGSQTIERYIDPNNPLIPDYADPAVTTPLSDFYRFRVVSTKQFAP